MLLPAPLLGAAPRVTQIGHFVPLEILPSWALEMSQGPSVLPWEGETGRHGEGTLRALLSSWEFVSFSFWRDILNHIYVFLQS